MTQKYPKQIREFINEYPTVTIERLVKLPEGELLAEPTWKVESEESPE